MNIISSDIPSDISRLMEQTVGILKSSGIERAVLFGSHAAGHASYSSDIDIAVWPGTTFDVWAWFDMNDQLEGLDTLRGWDVVDMTRVASDSVIAQEVRDHGIELFQETRTA